MDEPNNESSADIRLKILILHSTMKLYGEKEKIVSLQD